VDEDDIEKSSDVVPYHPTVRNLTFDTAVIQPCTTAIVRIQKDLTSVLASLVTSTAIIRLPVLVESAYYTASDTKNSLAHRTTLLGIVGRVGISGVLPTLQSYGGVRVQPDWGVLVDNGHALVGSLAEKTTPPSPHVEIHTSIGARLNIGAIDKDEQGNVGVFLCGPVEMADEVRQILSKMGRGFVLVDEAFAW
jgi:hypothetical protein